MSILQNRKKTKKKVNTVKVDHKIEVKPQNFDLLYEFGVFEVNSQKRLFNGLDKYFFRSNRDYVFNALNQGVQKIVNFFKQKELTAPSLCMVWTSLKTNAPNTTTTFKIKKELMAWENFNDFEIMKQIKLPRNHYISTIEIQMVMDHSAYTYEKRNLIFDFLQTVKFTHHFVTVKRMSEAPVNHNSNKSTKK